MLAHEDLEKSLLELAKVLQPVVPELGEIGGKLDRLPHTPEIKEARALVSKAIEGAGTAIDAVHELLRLFSPTAPK